jgi:hypothetical protein
MSDADAASIRAARADWTKEHLGQYLSSGGAQGHILDLRSVGGHAVTTHCLIKVLGRSSGKGFVKPLIYGNVGGEIVIVASKGGADTHPQATWREPEGQERHQVWTHMSHLYPPYLAYQASTERHIPVVMLEPVRPIDVFTVAVEDL